MGGRLLPLVALLGAAVAVDWCTRLNPCVNGGTCSQQGSAWACRCPGSWRGKRCQTGQESAELTGTSAAGRKEAGDSPSPLGSSGQSHPAPPTAPTIMPPSMAAGSLSLSSSPAEATVHRSSPLSLSGGFSTEGVPGGWQATSPSQGPGTRAQVAVHPPLAGPRSEAAWAAIAAGNETSRTIAAPTWHSPLSGPGFQEERATSPPTEVPGPSLAAVGQPVTGVTLADPFWSANSAEAPEEDVAALAEMTRSGSAAPQTMEPEEFPWPSEGSEAYGETGRKVGLHAASTRHPEPWSAERLLSSSPGPPRSQTPPRLSVGLDFTVVEDMTPGNSVGIVGPAAPHKKAVGQSSILLPSAGVPSVVVRGSEATPSSTSSFPAATLDLSPDSLPYRPTHAPDASQLVPSPSLPLGPGEAPTAPTGKMGALGTAPEAGRSMAVLQTSTPPLLVPGAEPSHAPLTHKSTEPFSTLSDLAQAAAVLAQRPPNQAAEGGTSANLPFSSRETSAGATDGAAWAADSGKGLPTAPPEEGFPRQASQPAGETTEPPASRIQGKGDSNSWGTRSLTESQTNSASAIFATREDHAPSGGPGRHTQTAFFSSPTSAVTVPTGQVGETVALSPLSVTHQSWAPPARTWRWNGASHPNGPGRKARPFPRGPGPLTTEGNSGLTWPPARGDPPIASTWLLAVVPEAVTQLVPATPREIRTRVQRVFVAENQSPVLKVAFLRLPWELFLAMEFPRSVGSPHSPAYQGLVLSINETVTPLLAALPGFQRLEVRSIRPGGVLVRAEAVFLAEASGLWAALNGSGLWQQRRLPGLWVGNSSVVWSLALEKPLDLCAELFLCPAGYNCVVGEDGNPTCASVCHQAYCKNQGICTHQANQMPVCQCPVGSDFWFLGVRCDYKVTQQSLLGVACGLLLSLVVIGAAISGLVARRVRMLLLEARADQTKSSYRRFCRLDDVSAHYWSEPWLASVNSLDNPAFSNSEELLQLQTLEPGRCSCQGACLAGEGYRKPPQGRPSRGAAGRPRSLCSWERSSGGGSEHMIDSGKASEVSVSSWPMQPIQWSPSPALHGPSRRLSHNGRRPHSYCEGMELIHLERSWTA